MTSELADGFVAINIIGELIGRGKTYGEAANDAWPSGIPDDVNPLFQVADRVLPATERAMHFVTPYAWVIVGGVVCLPSEAGMDPHEVHRGIEMDIGWG